MDLDTEVRPQGNLKCFSGSRMLSHSSDSLPLRHSDHSIKGASGPSFHDDSSMHTTRHKNCDAGGTSDTQDPRWAIDEATLTGTVNFLPHCLWRRISMHVKNSGD